MTLPPELLVDEERARPSRRRVGPEERRRELRRHLRRVVGADESALLRGGGFLLDGGELVERAFGSVVAVARRRDPLPQPGEVGGPPRPLDLGKERRRRVAFLGPGLRL